MDVSRLGGLYPDVILYEELVHHSFVRVGPQGHRRVEEWGACSECKIREGPQDTFACTRDRPGQVPGDTLGEA